MKGLYGAFFAIMLSMLAMPVSSEEKRALVIGNGSYQHLGTLRNPVNDAKAITQTLRLRSLGFQVTELHNRNRKQMARAISQFGNSIKLGSVVLVYFAGHGGQYQGENYLFPVDFNAQDEKELSIEAVSTKFIMDHLKSNTNGLNILILDACRNNPLSSDGRFSSRGLTRIDNAPPNTYSIYATSPGKVASDNPHGANGLFTQHLVRYMKQPGLDLGNMVLETRKDVMKASSNKQIPYDYGTLTRRFCMAGCKPVDNEGIVEDVKPSVFAEQNKTKPAANSQHSHGNRSHVHPLPAAGLNHQHGNVVVKPIQTVTQRIAASNKRFRVNSDGTVSDSNKGLMWKRCSEGLSGATCQGGSLQTYTWQKAMDLKGSSFAGYSDWRLPTIKELRGLTYCSSGATNIARGDTCAGDFNNQVKFEKPTIDKGVFPNTKRGWYWSGLSGGARSVELSINFDNGFYDYIPKTLKKHVRLVRGGRSTKCRTIYRTSCLAGRCTPVSTLICD